MNLLAAVPISGIIVLKGICCLYNFGEAQKQAKLPMAGLRGNINLSDKVFKVIMAIDLSD